MSLPDDLQQAATRAQTLKASLKADALAVETEIVLARAIARNRKWDDVFEPRGGQQVIFVEQ